MIREISKFVILIISMVMVAFMALIIFVPAILGEAGEITKGMIVSAQSAIMPNISNIIFK
ncbi:hypothetical protein KAU33_15365 [Candidatus Dependentiae bacterium]|nr:hypothetical protein [Candidatus Dependentiae bacterium]